MRVLTLQTYDLRTFAGPIRLGRGSYRDDAHISGAQRRLYDLIKEDQVVWFYQYEPLLHGKQAHYLHEIDVDERDIVAVIDALVWHHILKYDAHYIPSPEYKELRNRAAISEDYDETLRNEVDAYLAQNLPDDLWTNVRKPAVSKKSDELLLKFPFEFSTIAHVDIVTEEIANDGHRRKKRQITRRWTRAADQACSETSVTSPPTGYLRRYVDGALDIGVWRLLCSLECTFSDLDCCVGTHRDSHLWVRGR